MSKQQLTPAQRAWLADLRSGKFKQTSGALQDYKLYDDDAYCCLGVACRTWQRLRGIDENRDVITCETTGRLLGTDLKDQPGYITDWLGIHNDGESECVAMNDERGFNFQRIADAIEGDPAAFFEPPPPVAEPAKEVSAERETVSIYSTAGA